MTNFQRIKDELDKSGELMLKIDSGEKLELHKHNVSDESTQEIKVDASSETYWISADSVAYYWIHRRSREGIIASFLIWATELDHRKS